MRPGLPLHTAADAVCGRCRGLLPLPLSRHSFVAHLIEFRVSRVLRYSIVSLSRHPSPREVTHVPDVPEIHLYNSARILRQPNYENSTEENGAVNGLIP